MRIRAHIALLTALMLTARAAGAADVPPSLPVTPDVQATADGRLSLSPDTFQVYLRQQVALEGCNLRLNVRDQLLKDTAAQAERSWFERNAFWLGLGLGFVGAIGLTWGTVKTLSTAR